MIMSLAAKLASFANTPTKKPKPNSPIIIPTVASPASTNIKSILKPKSSSLEPKDNSAKSKSNTPRKVQFHIIEGQQYGGRGQTEFVKTPQRKSHTKRQLPIGIFDTTSSTNGETNEIDENTNPNIKNDNISVAKNNSLLNNINSQKIIANSRLVRLVKRKKKRKEKEEKWLTMISPDIGLYNNQKTKSKINNYNNSNSNNMNVNVNTSMNTFKSPSHFMSRGRRAWYKAHKQLNNNKIDNNTKKSENNTQTLIIPHTPIHKKVTDIAMENERKSKLELISEIEMKDHSGDNSEQNSVDSDEMKTNNSTDLNDDEDDDIINKINKINNNPITRLENNLENKSPSEDINFNNENENENNEQRRLSFTITVPSDDTLEPIQYLRSIGTQTENIQCEIGIQTYKQSILPMNQNNNNNNILLQNQNNNQTIITLSNGIKYVKINENINHNNNNNVNNGSIDIDDIPTANVNDNNTQQNIQQLQSLSLNIENIENVEINTKSKTRLKRKYNETMCDNHNDNHISKRRKINNNNNNNNRIKYQKYDIIWIRHKGKDEPTIIINCEYDLNEKFYPSKYKLLWLNWTDTTNDNNRKGYCSITIESYNCIKSLITNNELMLLFNKCDISNDGWKEIKKYRPDIYNKFFDLNDNKKITNKQNINKKRRASVI